GAEAARPATDRARRNKATRPCARRRSPAAASRASSARKDWSRAIRNARRAMATAGGAPGFAPAVFRRRCRRLCPTRLCPFLFALALRLPEELKPVVPAPDAGWNVEIEEISARAPFAVGAFWKRAFFGSPSS